MNLKKKKKKKCVCDVAMSGGSGVCVLSLRCMTQCHVSNHE